ncbi:MAG: hypothetical protein KatS3mg131_1877 [Candidatus Tectimicrobiota bacterium]|nr:MAG: hypothetical protein KatS3mg131_1877 [Candidatus Tectomicrobia bacterium]
MRVCGWRVLGVLALVLVLGAALPSAAGEVKKFTLINVELDGTKIWLPSSLIVQEGDEVELTLDNKLTAPHGFKIAEFGVEVEVPSKRKSTVRFTASKAGLYPFICHLHPPHIGGQILVVKP